MATRHIPAKAPISTHPAFPVIVAAWFATLLGIGSLLVPAALFEYSAAASGLTAIVPSAEAPLGFNARMLIAAALAAIGGVAGLLLARRVAASQPSRGNVRVSRAHSHENKVPISALNELGAASFDHPVDGGHGALPDADVSEAADVETPALQVPASENPADDDGISQEVAPDDCVTPSPALVESDFEAPQVGPAPETGMAAENLLRTPLDELGIVQLVERFALSLQQRPASDFHRSAPFDDAAEASPEPSPADFGVTADYSAPDDEEGDEEFSSLLALRKIAAEPRKSVTLPADDECELADTVAVFPGQEGTAARRRFDAPHSVIAAEAQPSPLSSDLPSGTDETERTLRGALDQLRKMSGTR